MKYEVGQIYKEKIYTCYLYIDKIINDYYLFKILSKDHEGNFNIDDYNLKKDYLLESELKDKLKDFELVEKVMYEKENRFLFFTSLDKCKNLFENKKGEIFVNECESSENSVSVQIDYVEKYIFNFEKEEFERC